MLRAGQCFLEIKIKSFRQLGFCLSPALTLRALGGIYFSVLLLKTTFALGTVSDYDHSAF